MVAAVVPSVHHSKLGIAPSLSTPLLRERTELAQEMPRPPKPAVKYSTALPLRFCDTRGISMS